MLPCSVLAPSAGKLSSSKGARYDYIQRRASPGITRDRYHLCWLCAVLSSPYEL